MLYGFSAASGKLGSVLGQVVVVKVQSNKQLGITLILYEYHLQPSVPLLTFE